MDQPTKAEIGPNQYQCSVCGGIFDKGWSDEQAVEELKKNFSGSGDPDDCDILCDDCYKKFR